MILHILAIVSAEILSYQATFDVKSPGKAEYTVHETVAVYENAGESAGVIVLMTDSFRKLKSFSGEITFPNGNVKKIRKSDLEPFAPYGLDGGDACIHTYKPAAPYPYIVSYSYTISYGKGFMSVPAFTPIRTTCTALRDAHFDISVPVSMKLKILSNCKHTKTSVKGKDLYSWDTGSSEGVSDRYFTPPIEELVPYVYAEAEEFSYGKFKGRQKDWSELGDSFSKLISSSDGLPEDAKSLVGRLTRDCQDDDSKIEVLYRYLREKTRYVSIQFGLGGYRPLHCKEVHNTGFGDCKALSNYMKNLLAAAGIRSQYFILSTDRRRMPADFACASLADHAMLAIPRQSDTLWMECTNPSVPLGYRHSDVAGHDVLLIDGMDSRLVKVKGYTEEENAEINHYMIEISSGDEVQIYCHRQFFAEEAQEYIEFTQKSSHTQERILAGGFGINTDKAQDISSTDNFSEWASCGFIPCVELDYKAKSRSAIHYQGKNRMIRINPACAHLPLLPSDRNSDIYIGTGRSVTDITRLTVPAGKQIKLPADMHLECEMGSFSSESDVHDGTVTVTQKLILKAGTYKKQSYGSFRSFAQSVRQAQNLVAVVK